MDDGKEEDARREDASRRGASKRVAGRRSILESQRKGRKEKQRTAYVRSDLRSRINYIIKL